MNRYLVVAEFTASLLSFPSEINPLKKKRRPLHLKTKLYRAVSTCHLGYKIQSFYAVSGISAVCSEINTKYVNTVWAERTVIEC